MVSLHLPAESVNCPLITKSELALMKEETVLINTARGRLIDEQALADALSAGKIAGAGLDTFIDEPPIGSPLLELENVVLSPHLGGRTIDGQQRMGELVIKNCVRALRGERPLFIVE